MKKPPHPIPHHSHFFEAFVPYFILAGSFLLCFKEWLPRLTSEVFLSLDSTVLYFPVYHWVHQHLAQDRLPLLCDLAYHGAPIAAVSMAGVLSPVLWLFHLFSNEALTANLLFLTPFALFLFGTYVLGRQMGFSISACLLLAFLWTYNGQRMAQLDHWNVAWACAFFPWAFWALHRRCEGGSFFWLALSGLFWGLNLLSGHPQIFFLEGLFFLSWALLAPGPLTLIPRIKAFVGMTLLACLAASPLILFVGENLSMGGFHFKWSEVDRFFHSWTPLNFLTLLFPWFFGRDQFDRQDSDYWWQYQFVEMQTALSITGLFFILLFFMRKNPHRRWIGLTALFGLAMALGKFFFLYGWIQSLPVFSWFRDPARYWHLINWVVGLGAAYAWDWWFHPQPLREKRGKNNAAFPPAGSEQLFKTGRQLALWFSLFGVTLVAVGWTLLSFGRPLLESAGAWLIRHFLLGDSLHQQPLSFYLARLPEKLTFLSFSLDPRNPVIYIPLLFLGKLFLVIWNKKKINLDIQKGFLLALVFADLMLFRMPLGEVFYRPSDIPAPAYAAPANRSLVMLYQNVSPLPPQYGMMAYPNMNLVSGRPNLVIDANPALPGYDSILKELGWFSWVYADRDPAGFSKRPDLLKILGVDQIVSDTPLKLPAPFKTSQDHYPYVYSLPGTSPRAALDSPGSSAALAQWDETELRVMAQASTPGTLVLQKTFLPGWKAFVNGVKTKPFISNRVLSAVALDKGKSLVELRYEPVSLRVGFFLFFVFFGVFVFFLLRLRVVS